MMSTPKTLAGHPLVGALFETAVVGEIRKLASTLTTAPSLCHWRSPGGAEVDILLESDGRFIPIEIELTTQPRRRDCRGIASFRKTYPKLDVAPGLAICLTERVPAGTTPILRYRGTTHRRKLEKSNWWRAHEMNHPQVNLNSGRAADNELGRNAQVGPRLRIPTSRSFVLASGSFIVSFDTKQM